ncbi:MAG: hypothetical protein WC851_01445 [Candidatus Shapirobacteria bacterium]|jgi:hypothetical protein
MAGKNVLILPGGNVNNGPYDTGKLDYQVTMVDGQVAGIVSRLTHENGSYTLIDESTGVGALFTADGGRVAGSVVKRRSISFDELASELADISRPKSQ